MNVLVESLKRLYSRNDVTEEKLKSMLKSKKISKAEYDYIVNQ